MSLCRKWRKWLQPSLPSSIVKWAEDRQERTNTFFMAVLVDGGEGVGARETGEWWLLLTVETELNGGSNKDNERGAFSFGSLSYTLHYFNSIVPMHRTASWAASRAGSPVSLCAPLRHPGWRRECR